MEYDPHSVPTGAVLRMTPPGNVGSEGVPKNSKGKAKREEVGTSGEEAETFEYEGFGGEG